MTTNFNSFVLRPVEANFFEETNILFKQDPYVLFTVGDQKFRTKVDKKGGLHPHWSDHFNIEGLADAMATIQVYDKDILIPDNLLGEAVLSLSNRFFGDQSIQKIDLFKNEKRVGEITLEFQPHTPESYVAGGLTGMSGGIEYPLKETPVRDYPANEYPVGESELTGPKPFGKVVEDVKRDFGTLGHKIADLGKKIETKLGFGGEKDAGQPANPFGEEPLQQNLKTSEPVEPLKGDTLSAGIPPSNVDNTTLNKGNVEYFGQDSTAATLTNQSNLEDETLNVQGQELHKIVPPEDRHDIGAEKLGPSLGLEEEIKRSGLDKTEKDFNVAPGVDNSDNWSTVSNQGSIVDKSEVPVEGSEKKRLIDQGKDLLEQGKEKMSELGQKSKQTMNNLGDKLTEVFTDRSHNKPDVIPADRPIDLHRPLDRPLSEPGFNNDLNKTPTIVEKSKENVTDFTHKAIDELGNPLRSPSSDQVIPAEGPKDIDAIDVGPQNFNIDKKFNNDRTLDKREIFENEAIIGRTNELPKESIFDKGFESRGLAQKAEELHEDRILDKGNKLKLDDEIAATKPTLSFDNQDTKSQFLDTKVGLHTEKPLQGIPENEA